MRAFSNHKRRLIMEKNTFFLVILGLLLVFTVLCGCEEKENAGDPSMSEVRDTDPTGELPVGPPEEPPGEKEKPAVKYPGFGYFSGAGLDTETERMILEDFYNLYGGVEGLKDFEYKEPSDLFYIKNYYGTYNNGSVVALRVDGYIFQTYGFAQTISVGGVEFVYPYNNVIRLWIRGELPPDLKLEPVIIERGNWTPEQAYIDVWRPAPPFVPNGFFCSLYFAEYEGVVTGDDFLAMHEWYKDAEKSGPWRW
jgi:hypothetical protein